MKLTILLLIVGLMQVSATVYSQATKFNFEAENKQIAEVLKEIEETSNFRFFYIREQVDVERNVSVKLINVTVEEILDELFKNEGISYRVLEDNLVLLSPENISSDKEKMLQQQNTVSGKVTDEGGQPLPGVTVIIKGTTNGTVTNMDGKYSISSIPDDATLVISFIGMQTQEILVGSQTEINVLLVIDAIGIEEVIAIGYGTQKKRDIVGSITSVTSESIEKSGSIDVVQALQGNVPGLSISRSNGAPGNTGSILVRGQNSIKASNRPLIILDGIPYDGALGDINPNDIESIEVLKDASASAIYGSKASNGVLLITTKGGIKGKPTIEFNVSTAFQKPAVKPDYQKENEYLAFKTEAYRSGGYSTDPVDVLNTYEYDNYVEGISQDWYDLMTQTVNMNEYQLGVKGGTENLTYYFSVSHADQNGLVRNTGYERTSLKINLENKFSDWLTVSERLLITNTNTEDPINLSSIYSTSPYAKMYEEDGSYTIYPMYGDNFLSNVYADNELVEREDKGVNIFNNLSAIISIPGIKNLSYRINSGYNKRTDNSNRYYPREVLRGNLVDGYASVSGSAVTDWTLENIVKYNNDFGDHTIDLTGLYSAQHREFSSYGVSAQGFISDEYLWHNLSAATIPGTPSTNFREWNLTSSMFRLNYDYNNKYYLTATGRRDGFSAFGENHKYGFFPSAAAAWRISSEQFMNDIDWLSDLKIRASYGIVGNQSISEYSSLARLSNASHVFGTTTVSGLRLSSMANPDLKWETTSSLNFAIDYSILSGKFNGSLDYYKSHTSNLLMDRSIPNMTGFTSVSDNIGKVMNSGFEFAMNGIALRKTDFEWSFNFNLSYNHNEIEGLYGEKVDDIGNGWFIGESIHSVYTQKFDGVWQLGEEEEAAVYAAEPGSAKLRDLNTDSEIDNDDKMIIGSTTPTWIGGLTNNFKYKNFTFSVFVYTAQDFLRVLDMDYYSSARFPIYNIDFWTPDNPSNTFAGPNFSGMTETGSMNYFDSSFWRIKDINLSYNVPEKYVSKLKMKSCMLYVNLHDYFLFTDFPFADPEMSTSRAYPLNKSMKFGVKISL